MFKILYQGKIIEVVQETKNINGQDVIFEQARRSPGVRLIIHKGPEYTVTKEFRREHNNWDVRLPGGKVFDSLDEYNEFIAKDGDIIAKATAAAIKEAREEVGLQVKSIQYYKTSKCGATVEWDLLYFIVNDFELIQEGQQLELGEDIKIMTVNGNQLKDLCYSGQISEDRTLGILLKYLYEQNHYTSL